MPCPDKTLRQFQFKPIGNKTSKISLWDTINCQLIGFLSHHSKQNKLEMLQVNLFFSRKQGLLEINEYKYFKQEELLMQQHSWEKRENINRQYNRKRSLQILKRLFSKTIAWVASSGRAVSSHTQAALLGIKWKNIYVMFLFGTGDWDLVINWHAQALASVIR